MMVSMGSLTVIEWRSVSLILCRALVLMPSGFLGRAGDVAAFFQRGGSFVVGVVRDACRQGDVDVGAEGGVRQ